VKQHNPSNKQWHTISYYNESGNFLGPAIFDTERQAQEYLKEYKTKMTSHLASININSDDNNQELHHHLKQNNKSANPNDNEHDKKHSISKKRGKGRPSRNERIRLKVFQESKLPPVDKPSFFFHS
jgi:hypothetical protein